MHDGKGHATVCPHLVASLELFLLSDTSAVFSVLGETVKSLDKKGHRVPIHRESSTFAGPQQTATIRVSVRIPTRFITGLKSAKSLKPLRSDTLLLYFLPSMCRRCVNRCR